VSKANTVILRIVTPFSFETFLRQINRRSWNPTCFLTGDLECSGGSGSKETVSDYEGQKQRRIGPGLELSVGKGGGSFLLSKNRF